MPGEKVYFIHRGYMGSGADFFIKGIKPVTTEEEAREVEDIDYYMPDCRYVKAFLEAHPEYVYIGSSDDMHALGGGAWGMGFDGYEAVKCPVLKD